MGQRYRGHVRGAGHLKRRPGSNENSALDRLAESPARSAKNKLNYCDGLSEASATGQLGRLVLAKMLDVTRRELEKAYYSYRNHYGQCSSHPLCLLLVYCVECGLKALLMRHHRVDRYSALPADSQVGHDLMAALIRLRAPANLTIRRASTVHSRAPQQPITPNQLHQAYRYGIPIDPHSDINADLQTVVAWIEERL